MVEYEIRDNKPYSDPKKDLPKQPVKVDEGIFLVKNKITGKVKDEKIDKLKSNDPYLLLMMNDGTSRWISDVREGLFTLEKKKKSIDLENKKLFSLNYHGEEIKHWVAYEDEATAYPTNVIHDSKRLNGTLRKIVFDYTELNRNDKKFNPLVVFMIVACIVTIIVYLGVKNGWFAGLMGG